MDTGLPWGDAIGPDMAWRAAATICACVELDARAAGDAEGLDEEEVAAGLASGATSGRRAAVREGGSGVGAVWKSCASAGRTRTPAAVKFTGAMAPSSSIGGGVRAEGGGGDCMLCLKVTTESSSSSSTAAPILPSPPRPGVE
jgi:hypothetical protein